MQTRPIREILNSSVLRPVGRGSIVRDRREKDRFKCRLPAVMKVGDREFPVECLEISVSGARIASQRPLCLTVGDHLEVRIRIGPQNFADRFSLVRTSHSQAGPINFHLRLQEEDPPLPAAPDAEATPAIEPIARSTEYTPP